MYQLSDKLKESLKQAIGDVAMVVIFVVGAVLSGLFVLLLISLVLVHPFIGIPAVIAVAIVCRAILYYRMK